jgi:hypothetical protein
LIQGKVGAPPLTHLRGNAAIVSSRNAALQLSLGTPRAWRSLPGDYEDAALRLKNGSCEDDEPSQVFRIAPPRERGEHGRPDRGRHWPGYLIVNQAC